MTGVEKIQMIADKVEGVINDYETAIISKEDAVKGLTNAVLELVFQESFSWANQVNNLNWATKDAFVNPDNELVAQTYIELKRSLNARIKTTFELKGELERVKEGGQNG